MKRTLMLMYGVTSYVMFLATTMYFVGFLGNIGITRTIDAAPTLPLAQALLIDIALIALFGVQHSVMARPGFKRVWTKVVPQAAERSTYCIASCVALMVMFYFWQPLGGVIWDVESPLARTVLYAMFASGWLTVVATSFLINHFDLFGLRQVWLYYQGKEYTHPKFATPGPYRYVRHPLYIGWLLAFWATPTMTVTHLVFALGMLAYILVAIRFEERDLAEVHGDAYVAYRKQTPMFIPKLAATGTVNRELATESQSDLR